LRRIFGGETTAVGRGERGEGEGKKTELTNRGFVEGGVGEGGERRDGRERSGRLVGRREGAKSREGQGWKRVGRRLSGWGMGMRILSARYGSDLFAFDCSLIF